MKKLLFATLLAGCIDEQSVGSTSNNTTRLLGTPRWAIALGDTNTDGILSVSVAANGDVIAGGYYAGTVDFGGTVFTAPAAGDWSSPVLTRRAAADGHEVWTRVLPTLGDISNVVVAPDDTIVVLGTVIGPGTIGVEGLPAWDYGIAKYSSDGTELWKVPISTFSNALAVAPNGRIAIAGPFQHSIAFPNGTFTTDNEDGFVEVFDADGRPQWGAATRHLDVGTSPQALGIAFSTEGDLLVTGTLATEITFGGGSLEQANTDGGWAARFTTAGALEWAVGLGDGSHVQTPNLVVVGANGDARVVAGRRSADAIGATLPLVENLDVAGATMSSQPAVHGNAEPMPATLLGDGTLVTAGYTSGAAIDLGAGPMQGPFYLALQDASGNLVEAHPYGVNSSDGEVYSLASRAHTLAVGGWWGEIDLGNGPLRHAGGWDMMIAAFELP